MVNVKTATTVRDLVKETSRKIQLVETIWYECPNCMGNYIIETGEDDYGSYYQRQCQACFLGSIMTMKEFDVRLNKNGTYSIIKPGCKKKK